MALRVGLLGAGFMGRAHGQIFGLLEDVELVAVACKEQDVAEKHPVFSGIPVYDDAERMMDKEKLDLVSICLPTYLHSEYAVKAAQRGLHVLTEKPIALTLDEADRSIEAASEAGVKFMVAHCIRFWPEYVYLKRIVESGEFGALKAISMLRGGGPPLWSWDNWLMDPARSGSIVMDLQIHDFDFLQVIAGKPLDVRALGFGDGDMWMHSNSLFRCPNNVSARVEGTWAMPDAYGFAHGYTALFEDGAVAYNLKNNPPVVTYRGKETHHPELEIPDIPTANAGGNVEVGIAYLNEIKYFLDCIREDKQPDLVPPEESREALKLCLATRKSVETGRIVEIPTG